ncbi:MAG: EAL domain-containing protein [Pseudomonadota bacterium]
MLSWLEYINRWVDRGTGLSDLSSAHRKLVRGAQLQSIADMLPLALAGTTAVGVLLLTFSVDTDVFPYLMGVITVATLVQGYFCGIGASDVILRPNKAPRPVGALGTRVYLLMTLVAACVWSATLLKLAGTTAAEGYAFTLGIIVCASLLISIYIFAAFVQAVIVFAVVTALAMGFVLVPNLSGAEATGIISLLTGYVIVVPGMTLVSARNFVKRTASELAQRESSEQLGQKLSDFEESSHEWFWETNEHGNIVKASDDLLAALRVEEKSELGTLRAFQHISSVVEKSASDLERFKDAILHRKPFRKLNLCINHTDGPAWIQVSGKPVYHKSGKFSGYIGVGADVTIEKTAESRIVEMAHYDGLTGLLNRSSFASRLEAASKDLARNETPFMLMFLDLDKFKLVNDTYGHHTGDELLKMVAKRLSQIVRQGDAVARLGGDEFAILFHNTNDPIAAACFASRIVESVSRPYDFETHFAVVGTSIGVAMAPQHGKDPDQLLRNADLALYRAKEDGRGLFRFFEDRMDTEEREKRTLELDMRTALEEDKFGMYFQPKVCTETGRIVCFEALMRWEHETRGQVTPDEFIPLAEQSNLIVDIGRWTLRKACEMASNWPQDVCVAVNISATHFMRSEIVEDVKSALDEFGFDANRLEVEITESLMVANTADVAANLEGLKELGVSLALDDFGTGYSSLSYLTKFPFDRLKIDKSFIQDIETDRKSKAIMRAISTLSEDLDIAITVEGVETEAQVEFLKTIHCDQFQGYFFSSAIPQEEVSPLLLKNMVETDLKKPEPTSNVRLIG